MKGAENKLLDYKHQVIQHKRQRVVFGLIVAVEMMVIAYLILPAPFAHHIVQKMKPERNTLIQGAKGVPHVQLFFRIRTFFFSRRN